MQSYLSTLVHKERLNNLDYLEFMTGKKRKFLRENIDIEKVELLDDISEYYMICYDEFLMLEKLKENKVQEVLFEIEMKKLESEEKIYEIQEELEYLKEELLEGDIDNLKYLINNAHYELLMWNNKNVNANVKYVLLLDDLDRSYGEQKFSKTKTENKANKAALLRNCGILEYNEEESDFCFEKNKLREEYMEKFGEDEKFDEFLDILDAEQNAYKNILAASYILLNKTKTPEEIQSSNEATLFSINRVPHLALNTIFDLEKDFEIKKDIKEYSKYLSKTKKD